MSFTMILVPPVTRRLAMLSSMSPQEPATNPDVLLTRISVLIDILLIAKYSAAHWMLLDCWILVMNCCFNCGDVDFFLFHHGRHRFGRHILVCTHRQCR